MSMDLEDVMLSKISETEKGKYRRIFLICGIYKIKQMNKQSKNKKLIDKENRLVVARGAGGGGWGNGGGGKCMAMGAD